MIEIEIGWRWNTDNLKCSTIQINGTSIPADLVQLLCEHGSFAVGIGNELHKRATAIANLLGQALPEPEAFDFGTSQEVAGRIAKLDRLQHPKDKLHLTYTIEYENGLPRQLRHTFEFNEISQTTGKMVRELDSIIKSNAKSRIYAVIGRDQIDVQKWKAEKISVFISYRSRASEIAMQMFSALGEYENRTVFVPRIDKIDMQAGNWLDQLMNLINESNVFIPILTPDYLEGPISRPELNLALRRLFEGKVPERRIVPVLVEGEMGSYGEHFIGGYHIVDAKGGQIESVIDEIATLSLGISRNPYEQEDS